MLQLAAQLHSLTADAAGLQRASVNALHVLSAMIKSPAAQFAAACMQRRWIFSGSRSWRRATYTSLHMVATRERANGFEDQGFAPDPYRQR